MERDVAVDPETMAMLVRHGELVDERAATWGVRVDDEAYVFSLDPACSTPMPHSLTPGYVHSTPDRRAPRRRRSIPEAPFIVAPVHRSNVDFLVSATITKPRMRFMGKASIWKSKALGRFMSMPGAFPCTGGPPRPPSTTPCRASADGTGWPDAAGDRP